MCSFLTDSPPTEGYPLSLHDALPISRSAMGSIPAPGPPGAPPGIPPGPPGPPGPPPAPIDPGSTMTRSEEHTSELQSRGHLVCRLLLEKKTTPANRRPPAAQRVTATL